MSAHTLEPIHQAAESTTDAAFFEAMYRRNADPWSFATSAYELARYDAILHALEGRRYERALEPGCSVGVLTEQLAACCAAVEAIDISATAIAQAQARCVGLSNVRLTVGALPEAIPAGPFDLIVLSEIGYYFRPGMWQAVIDRLIATMQPGATLLAAHWLGTSQDHCSSGDAVHAALLARGDLRLELSERHEQPLPEAGFRLERWSVRR